MDDNSPLIRNVIRILVPCTHDPNTIVCVAASANRPNDFKCYTVHKRVNSSSIIRDELIIVENGKNTTIHPCVDYMHSGVATSLECMCRTVIEKYHEISLIMRRAHNFTRYGMTLGHVFGDKHLADGELLAWYSRSCEASAGHNRLQLLLRNVPWVTVKQHGESSTVVVNPKNLFDICEPDNDNECPICYDNEKGGGFISTPCCGGGGTCVHLECMLMSLASTDATCPFCKQPYFLVQ